MTDSQRSAHTHGMVGMYSAPVSDAAACSASRFPDGKPCDFGTLHFWTAKGWPARQSRAVFVPVGYIAEHRQPCSGLGQFPQGRLPAFLPLIGGRLAEVDEHMGAEACHE